MTIKHIFNRHLLVLLAAVMLLVSCGGDDNKDDTQSRKTMLTSGTWKVTTVTVNGTNQNALFTGFSITFSENTYTTTNGDPVWPASDTWQLQNGGTIVRGIDSRQISIDEISGNTLRLSLHWETSTLGGGRSRSVAGAHVFTFSK